MTILSPHNSSSYRRIIVLTGFLGLFASLGLGRFSLGMMLPAMGEALSLTYSEMGVISTVNFCGYLGAVLLCGVLTAKLGIRLLVSLALLLVGFSMVLIGFSSHYLLLLLLYFLTGVGSALSNVPIMGLIAVWFDSKSRGRVAGLCVTGNGIGILVTGKYVPVFNEMAGDWRGSWVVLGCLAVIIAFICFLLIRNRPRGDGSESTSRVLSNVRKTSYSSTGSRIFYHCAAIYFFFGFTYVIYVTFFVTALVQDYGLSEQVAGTLWSWVGFLSLASGPLFGFVSDRYGRKAGLVIVFTIQTMAYLLAALELSMVFIYLSVGCFGIVLWSVPTIMAALVGDCAGPEKAAKIFGFVTFAFGIGQVAGPVCAGVLAEYTGSFSTSFLLAAIFAAVAVLFSLLLPGKLKDT
jgi:MFS family permease